MAADETSPLLRRTESRTDQDHAEGGGIEHPEDKPARSVLAILSVLLLGVFVSQADVFLVISSYGYITADLGALEDGAWLLTSYVLAQSAAQPLYGKMSDIFGRKRCLQASYVLFSAGTLLSSLAQSMPQIIASRALEGLGGAGMVCMVSILLTDLVPLQKVAIYRSYVNIVQTVGRSCGAVVGGYVAQNIGWRWGFFMQCPIVLTGLVLTQWKLPATSDDEDQDASELPLLQKLKRIDFLGAFLLSSLIAGALLFADLGGQKLGWDHPASIACAIVALISAGLFALVETYYAAEPIFPLRLLTYRSVVCSYLMTWMQSTIITSVLFTAPLYFQIVQGLSASTSGVYLIAGPVGNTISGLLTGWWIGRTRRYKGALLFSAVCSLLTFLGLIMFWREQKSFFVPLLLLPMGFATGIVASASFIGLGAGIDPSDMAIAASGLYLFSNVGTITGVASGTAIYQTSLKAGLEVALEGFQDKAALLKRLLNDIEFAQHARGALREAILPVYVASFQWVFMLGMFAAVVVLLCSAAMRNAKI